MVSFFLKKKKKALKVEENELSSLYTCFVNMCLNATIYQLIHLGGEEAVVSLLCICDMLCCIMTLHLHWLNFFFLNRFSFEYMFVFTTNCV